MAKPGRKRLDGARYESGRLLPPERRDGPKRNENREYVYPALDPSAVAGLSLFEKMARKTPMRVYVIAKADGTAVKIGISENVRQRCTTLQVSQDVPILVFWAVRLARPEAYAVEQHVHKSFKKNLSHKRGEWYTVEPKIAVRMIQNAIIKLGFLWMTDLDFGFDRGISETYCG